MPKHRGKRKQLVIVRHATTYDGESYPSRRKALRAKRTAGDRNGQPTLRQRGDKARGAA